MSELLQVAAALRRASHTDQVSVLATVVRTEGSTYRRMGARLVALPDGSYAGGVSAGCIEADVLLRTERVRAAGKSELITYDTRSAQDLVWGSGAGCGGRSELLLEPLDSRQALAKATLLRHVAHLRRRSVLATVIRASGIPLAAGEQAVLPHAGSNLTGFNGLLSQLRAVIELTAAHQLRVRSSSAVLHSWGSQELDIAYEVRSPRVRLCVCGAGPDALPLVRLAQAMGWQVTLVDHRPAMLAAERWPEVERIQIHSPVDIAAAIERADCDAAVVMSHNYERDSSQVGHLLAAGVAYVGVLGPRRRTLQMIEDLGVSDSDTARLFAPAGLDIGAETPAEIALAIVAEVQAVLTERIGVPLRARVGGIHDQSATSDSPEVTMSAVGLGS
jgi:xanthine/CO dehydrogenase XdhC/CoxF family maturation factor